MVFEILKKKLRQRRRRVHTKRVIRRDWQAQGPTARRGSTRTQSRRRDHCTTARTRRAIRRGRSRSQPRLQGARIFPDANAPSLPPFRGTSALCEQVAPPSRRQNVLPPYVHGAYV